MTIPVILDTDIGMDVDDVWALAFLLRCPELDLKLVVSESGDTRYGAALAAKLLEVAGRTDVPVAVGVPLDDQPKTHQSWLGDYDLTRYPGEVIEDGVGAICETIMASSDPVTLIAIGPLVNVAAALAREPEIASRARFVGMHGSLRRGYVGVDKPAREYNVKKHPLAAQSALGSFRDTTITPLDSCGTVALEGELFQQVLGADDPLTRAVVENHIGWFEAVRDWPLLKDWDPQRRSSILYDCVAVYLAFADRYLTMETLPVTVTEDGKTLIDEAGHAMACATGWRDYPAFQRLLVERLTGN